MCFGCKMWRFSLCAAFFCSGSFHTIPYSWSQDDSPDDSSSVENVSPEESVSDEAGLPVEKPRKRDQALTIDQLTPRERRELDRMNADQGPVLYRENTPYIRDWSYRSGVLELNVPAYDGWLNVTKKKDLYLSFSAQGVPGQTLSGVYVNNRYIRSIQSRYINFYVLNWVPERYAYKRFTSETFAPIKERLQEELVALRETTVEREDFRNFEDYLNFKFGKDEEVEEFVDGRMIKAVEGGDFLTYFLTSEFLIEDEQSMLIEPMVGTTTFGLVRGKLIRFDVRMAYKSRDDVARVLEFTQDYFDDMKRVNGIEKKKRR